MGDWGRFFTDFNEQLPLIMSGLENTLLLATGISITGFLFGILVFYLTLSQSSLVRLLIRGYISFFIGMPLIVLLFLMYYGMPTVGIRWSPLTVALIGFTLNIGAYNAAYLKTAYNGLEQSELDSAQAQGFSRVQIFRLIILPQVLRLSVPAMTNQVIRNIKDTSVAFLIQYTEFFARIQELASTNFQFFKAYSLAAVVYLVIVSIVVVFSMWLEKRLAIPGTHRPTRKAKIPRM
jgi:polar amino acid transport system permease protein